MDTLGIDIGNVIINNLVPAYKDGVEIDYLSEEYAFAPEMEGAMDSIRLLGERKFGSRMHLVSRASPDAQTRLLLWLDANDFYAKTGVPRENVHFCSLRHEKETHCVEQGITHFIDDRLEVLSHLIGKVPHLYLLSSDEDDVRQFREHLASVVQVKNWKEAVELMLA
jgi:hypothetical protein